MGSAATETGRAAETRSMPLRIAIYLGGILILGVGVGTVASMFAIGAICQVVSDAARGFYQRAHVPAA